MTGIRVQISGGERYEAALRSANIRENPAPIARALKRIGFEVQAGATSKIRRGGRQAPIPGKLTSRTGTGRRSIATDFSSLPFSVSVGSELGYMALHETGGTVSVSGHAVRAHTRTVAFGRKVAPFNVPGFNVRAHSARFPARPWLQPAVDDMVPERAITIINQERERDL